jgi:hypothetical protein
MVVEKWVFLLKKKSYNVKENYKWKKHHENK